MMDSQEGVELKLNIFERKISKNLINIRFGNIRLQFVFEIIKVKTCEF